MTLLQAQGPEQREGWSAPGSMVDVLRRQARRAADEEAFLWLENGEREGGRITFAGLDLRARAIAALALAHGLGGKPVLLAYPSGLDLVAAVFGCFYAGAIAVVAPLPGAQSSDRLRLLAIDSAAAGVLTVTSLVQKCLEETPAGMRVLATDGLDEEGDFAPPASPDPRALAMLQYTSGSTASPRGVMLSHANLLANLRAMAQATKIEEGETAVSWLPFHHDMGLFGFGFFPIYARLRCVLMPPVAFLKRPARWVEVISRYGGALSAGPCFAYDLCARRTTPEQRAALDLASWRVAVCGAEMIRPDVLERFADTFADAGFRRRALAPAYGLAESTLLAASVKAEQGFAVRAVDVPTLADGRAAAPTSADRARRLISCGRPWPGHELIVVDPIRRAAMPAGEVGEIWLRGPSVSGGYWGRPAETAETFDAALEDAHTVGRQSNPFSPGEKEGPTSEAWEDEGVRGRQSNPSPSQPLRGRAPSSPSGRGDPWPGREMREAHAATDGLDTTPGSYGEPSRGWLRTGDLGFLSEDGLVVTGRRKDMIIVRGANFDPLDLELAAEASHPALSHGGGGAFSFEDAAGERVVIVHEVERIAMKTLDPGAVVARVAEAMSLNFGLTLHDLVLLKSGALPRTTSGKVQRHLCRERYVNGDLPGLDEARHPELGRWRSARP